MARIDVRKANYASTRANATNSHQRWDRNADRAILDRSFITLKGVLHDLSDRELSRYLGRSVQAIQVRRTRLAERKSS